jgi:hypothetical protein
MNIEDDGKFLITSGKLSFSKITFIINTNAVEGYIITGTTESTEIKIYDCLMRMKSN